MKIVCISDLHGNLNISIPECDLLLIAGDICPVYSHKVRFQSNWLDREFRRWLEKVPAKKIIACAGNHDFVFQESPEIVPSLPWVYLQDDFTHFEGLKIYGTPWQQIFLNWAFNLSEEDLEKKWELIPDDVDIIVAHSPVYGYGDKATRLYEPGYEHTGSPSLLARIKAIKPKIFICGHIHEDYGNYQIPELPNTLVANVCLLDAKYRMVNKPIIFEL